jgi:hypothetical protein
MAGSQADAVHEGIAYDLEIDSSVGTPEDLARTLRERVFGPASFSGPFHEKGDVGR